MGALLAYVLSFLTALGCAALLTRAAQRRRGLRLLFWSAVCFWGLAFTNLLAIVDVFVVPSVSLYWVRLLTGLASMAVLVFGMVWEAK
jgi:hypothetical protein